MKSIKKQYIWSSVLLIGISVISLIIMAYGNIILYRHIVNVTTNVLPFTSKLNNMSNKLSVSLESLTKLTISGNKHTEGSAAPTWDEQIPLLANEIDLYIKASENEDMLLISDVMNQKLRALYASHWWVEDVSQFIGNQPATVIYERDVAPTFYRLQSALSGVSGLTDSTYNVPELKLMMSQTHLILNETISQISESAAAGNTLHFSRFKNSSTEVHDYIINLQTSVSVDEDRKKLVDWIRLQYFVYTNYAHKLLESRASSKWNIGLNIVNSETSVLTKDIKQLLIDLQQLNIEMLKQNALWAKTSTYNSFILAASLVVLFVLLGVLLTIRNSKRIVGQIDIIKTGIENIANGKLDIIEMEYNNELSELSKVFNEMQHTILRRRKKFVREKERLSEVIKIITHDMKSPLININGHSELIYEEFRQMQEHSLSQKLGLEDVKTSQKHIQKSTQRIDELINGILLYSEVAHKDIKLTRIVPEEIVSQLIQVNSYRLKTANVSLVINVGSLHTDEFAFKFIMSTLLDNAIQYQDKNLPLELEIGGDIDAANNLVIFSIKDNGLGISNDDGEQVFKMFEKNDINNGGHGIGLACARSMSERLNGDINYIVNPNQKGVTFLFSLQYIVNI